MFIGINLAAQNLFSTFNCQRSHLLTQSFACPINFLLHIGLSLCSNTSSLIRGLLFGILNDLRGSLLCISDDFGNLITTFSHEFSHTLFSLFEITFPTLGSSQAFGNFAGTLI
ncbi:hypothetical protein A7P93_04590 [Eikenella corrodens]|nr:hypothetical protein A7P93_04590 [Eikenella corrodens]